MINIIKYINMLNKRIDSLTPGDGDTKELTIDDITGLQQALDDASKTPHSHAIVNITNLEYELSSKYSLSNPPPKPVPEPIVKGTLSLITPSSWSVLYECQHYPANFIKQNGMVTLYGFYEYLLYYPGSTRSTVVFQLPSGARPPCDMTFRQGAGECMVGVNGSVTWYFPSNDPFVLLNGIIFPTKELVQS